MADIDDKLVYYKKNVPYIVGGRMFLKDPQGYILTTENPYIAVELKKLRDFKIANKQNIIEGLIIAAEEPSLDWETDNAVDDEQALALIKGNYITLKNTLEKITSLSIVQKMLELAKENDRPKKTLSIINARLEELTGDDDFISPMMMKGVE